MDHWENPRKISGENRQALRVWILIEWDHLFGHLFFVFVLQDPEVAGKWGDFC